MLNEVISSFLYGYLPIVAAAGLAILVYLWLDKKINITYWISKRIKTSDEWKPLVLYLFLILIIGVFGVIGIFIIDVPNILYNIICGLLAGIGLSYMNNFNAKRKSIRK